MYIAIAVVIGIIVVIICYFVYKHYFNKETEKETDNSDSISSQLTELTNEFLKENPDANEDMILKLKEMYSSNNIIYLMKKFENEEELNQNEIANLENFFTDVIDISMEPDYTDELSKKYGEYIFNRFEVDENTLPSMLNEYMMPE